MTPEQHLIQQIEQVLASVQLEKNPLVEDLAVQFSELCESANARLLQCLDFLTKGMRSEAINEAHNPPDLLELGQLFQSPTVKKWRNLCVDLELTIPQSLNQSILERLKEASVQEQGLEPLLKSYRRAVYQGDRHACIGLLRQIIVCDPDNPTWRNNLQPLEEEELPGLIQQAEIALAGEDVARIGELYAEFCHPQRVVPAPEALLERMRRALMSQEAAQLRREGAGLVAELQRALSSEDEVLVESVLQKMELLGQQEAFLEIPVGWEETRNAAGEWLQMKALRKERQVQFHEALDAFQGLLSRGKFNEAELRKEWEKLQQWELPVSEILAEQVKEALDALARRRHRNRVFAWAMVVLLLLAGAGVGAGMFMKQLAQKRHAEALVTLRELMEQKKYEEFQSYLGRLRKKMPKVVASLECEEMNRIVLKAMEQEAERDLAASERRYNELMDELKNIREHEYAGASDEKIRNLLSDAETLEKKLEDASKTGSAQKWKNDWQDWQERTRNAAREKASRIIMEPVQVARKALEEENSYPRLEDELQRIGELRKKLAAAEPSLPEADEESREAFVKVREQLNAWERDVLAKKARERVRVANEKVRNVLSVAQLALNTKSSYATLPDVRQKVAELRQKLKEVEPYRVQADEACQADAAKVLQQLDSWLQEARVSDANERIEVPIASAERALTTLAGEVSLAQVRTTVESHRRELDSVKRYFRQADQAHQERYTSVSSELEARLRQAVAQEANEKLDGPLSAARKALAARFKNVPLAQVQETVGTHRSALEKLRTYARQADDAHRNEYGRVMKALDDWEKTAKGKAEADRKLSAELKKLHERIYRQGADLKQYKAALEQYVKLAPSQDPLRADYSSVLARYDIYEQAVALGNQDVRLPLDEEGVSRIRGLLENGGLDKTIWSSDLKLAIALSMARDALSPKIRELLVVSRPMLGIFYLDYRPKPKEVAKDAKTAAKNANQAEWRRLYVKAPLHSRKDPDDPTVRLYWGKVFAWTELDPNPVEKHTKAVFNEYEFSTKYYDIQQSTQQEKSRLPYARFVSSFVAESEDQVNPFGYLFDGMEQILGKSDKEIELPLKALFVKKSLAILSETYGGVIPVLKPLNDAFAGIDTSVPWMNPDYQPTKEMTTAFVETMARVRPQLSRLKAELAVRQASTEWILNSGLAPAGTVQKDASGALVLVVNAGAPKEIWGISREAGKAGLLFNLISRDGKTVLPEARRFCTPGMPVFMPRNGHGVLDATIERKEVSRPAAWPDNAW